MSNFFTNPGQKLYLEVVDENPRRSPEGGTLIESLYLAARDHGASPAQLYPLQKVLVQLAAVADANMGRYALDLIAQLRRDSGWDEYQRLTHLSGLDRVKLLPRLLELELAGAVRRIEGGRFVRFRGPC